MAANPIVLPSVVKLAGTGLPRRTGGGVMRAASATASINLSRRLRVIPTSVSANFSAPLVLGD